MDEKTTEPNGYHPLILKHESKVKISDIFATKKMKPKLKNEYQLNAYLWQMDQLTIPTINNQKIKNLNLKPGRSPHFILFFMISCYIPIITAVIGPISHMFSIACLVNKWRVDKVTGKGVNDSSLILVLNCISLFLGGVSNVTLLLHFSNKISYIKAQIVNIIGWGMSFLLLVIDIILFKYLENDTVYEKDIGFWYAVYTCVLYFLCTILLLMHLVGYKLKKYKPTFNLSEDERAVMLYTFVLFVWISWGSWLYSKVLFENRSYGVAMYSLLCGALTVGFGDIYSTKVAGKIVSMVYFLCSIVIIGLIITLTSQIIKNTFKPIIHLHLCEKRRIEELKKCDHKNEQFLNRVVVEDDYLDPELVSITDNSYIAYNCFKRGNNYTDFVQFTKMRKLHLHYKSLTKQLGFMTSLTLFLIFWLFGAMIFKFSEDWSYFNAIYFAFLDCLLTIGYGDYILNSGSGRAFFVLFALAAIPLMTALINSVGEALSNIGWSFVKYTVLVARYIYETASSLLNSIFYYFTSKNLKFNNSASRSERSYSKRPLPFYFTADKKRQLEDNLEDLIELGLDVNVIKKGEYSENHEHQWLEKVLRMSKDYELLSQLSPKYKLSYQEWIDFFKLTYHGNENILNTKHFWLSHQSPIRFDTNEPRFVYLQLSHLLLKHLKAKKELVDAPKTSIIDPHVLGRNTVFETSESADDEID